MQTHTVLIATHQWNDIHFRRSECNSADELDASKKVPPSFRGSDGNDIALALPIRLLNHQSCEPAPEPEPRDNIASGRVHGHSGGVAPARAGRGAHFRCTICIWYRTVGRLSPPSPLQDKNDGAGTSSRLPAQSRRTQNMQHAPAPSSTSDCRWTLLPRQCIHTDKHSARN